MNFRLILAAILLINVVQLSNQAVNPTIECKQDSTYVDMSKFPGYKASAELKQSLCSYSGYLQDDLKNNLFYWYFPSSSILPLESIPLVVFINGPIGETVLQPLFAENGPLKFDTDKDGEVIVTDRLDSWTKSMSIVYVEMQRGVGFSDGEQQQNLKELGSSLAGIISQLEAKFPNQPISLYSREFGAKVAIEAAGNMQTLKRLIFDNPMINTAVSLSNTSQGALGLGVFGPEQQDLVADLEMNCQNAIKTQNPKTGNICGKIAQFYAINSELDPQDVRQNKNGYVSKSFNQLSQFFSKNSKSLSTLFHLTQFTGSFQAFGEQTFEQLQQYYGADYTSQLQQIMKTVNTSLFYGEFNLINGPLSGYITWMNTLQIEYENFPQKNLYTSGLMGEKSGVKLGYYYTVKQTHTQHNFFTLNQGGYLNTWLSYSQELVYNIATNLKDYCQTYNANDCNLSYGRQQFMNNCNENGNWDDKTAQCQCNEGYTLADCSEAILKFDGKKHTDFLKPREWIFLEYDNQGNENVLIQIISLTYLPKTKQAVNLDIYISKDGIATNNLGSVGGTPFQFSAQQNLNGQYSQILSQKGKIYISIRNSDFWEKVKYSIQSTVPSDSKNDQKNFWEKGKGGYVLNIVLFSLGCALFVGWVGLSIFFCLKK